MALQLYTGQVVSDLAIVTTTETVVATVTVAATPNASARVKLHGALTITLGASTTAVTLRIRRGNGITGTVVGEANPDQIETAAGSTEDHDVTYEDFPGEVAGQVYSLTVQQTAASANGSVLSAYIDAEVG
jgi:hypothetical protein